MADVSQSLNSIVDVSVTITPAGAALPLLNQGLIIGTKNVIPSVGQNSRIRKYTSLTAIATDGFALTDPEYIAAKLYFAQTPKPAAVWIGVQETTAIQTAIPTVANPGNGYEIGDILTVVQAGAQGGQVKVNTVGAGGEVLTVSMIEGKRGMGYSVAVGLATTGGSGNGAEIDITAVGETPAQAIAACRAAGADWYGVVALAAADADQVGIASLVQALEPPAMYFYSTESTDTLNAVKAITPNRAFGLQSTTQGGLFPDNARSAAAVMGRAFGLNTGLPGSYFTMMFKNLAGVAPDPFDATTIDAIDAANGNCYLNYANGKYTILQKGKMANGQFLDEVINVDSLLGDIQISVMDVLYSLPAAPLNEHGQSLILNAINGACERARTRGFISAGTWKGVDILSLKNGDPLPNGYIALSAPYSQQAQADRDERKAMPVYVAIAESGAIHSIVIGVFVQR